MNYADLRCDLAVVTRQSAMDPGDTMVGVLARLDAASKRPEIPERLEHYLSKRSYMKALEWLDDPALPHRP